jgi:glycine/D-amino acid oxidase-like deaminating enzyme
MCQDARIEIFNGFELESFSTSADGIYLSGKQWDSTCDNLLFATNAFSQKFIPQKNITPARNAVLLTAPLEKLSLNAGYHLERGYYYFRSIHNRILIGGGRHLFRDQEETTEFGVRNEIRAHLLDILKTHILPDQAFDIEMEWSGILGTGPTKEVIVTLLQPNVAAGVRLGGMGVAIGTLVGQELADLFR